MLEQGFGFGSLAAALGSCNGGGALAYGKSQLLPLCVLRALWGREGQQMREQEQHTTQVKYMKVQSFPFSDSPET